MKKLLLGTILITFPFILMGQGYALQFDAASSQYIEIPYDASLNPATYTVEVWAKTNQTGNTQGIFSSRNDTDGTSYEGYTIFLSGGDIMFQTGNGTSWDELTASYIVTTDWTHIACVFDNGTKTIYVNGVEEATEGSITVSQNTSEVSRLGAVVENGATNNTNYYFDGNIDELRIWNDVRTETEISAYLNMELAGTESGLVAYYQMSNRSGIALTDNSGSANTGTLTNGTTWVSSVALLGDAPAIGDGTSGSPYQITSLANLFWISQNSSVWGDYFIQTANIDASITSGWDVGSDDQAQGWTPVAFDDDNNGAPQFTGDYNGQGHTINNVYINRPSQSNVGLFGLVENVNIQDLGVTDCDITGDDQVGALAGETTEASGTTTITNCYSSGSVTAQTAYVGGLVGISTAGTITSCYSDATVSAQNGSGNSYAGGLLGATNGTVTECYSTGSVSGYSIVGGLIGNISSGTAQVDNCYSSASVTGNASGSMIGGFAGSYSDASTTDSYSVGVVSGGSSDVGGFIGISTSGTTTGCFWDTETSGQAASAEGTGKTTAEMKTQTTFTDAGWDFTTTWAISSGSYPFLSDNLPARMWTGSTDSDWFTATNWADDFVPDALSNVTIPSGTANDPVISSATTAFTNNLTIESGVLLTMNAGSKLTVSGALDNAGNITLESPASNGSSASLITEGSITNTGIMKIQRWVSQGTTNNDNFNWHSIGMPISAATAGSYFTGDYLLQYIELINGWTNIELANKPLVVGNGYLLKNVTLDKTYDFTGTFNDGDITVSSLANNEGTSGSGFHLLSNPYPSSIDLETLIANSTDIGDVFYVWDPSVGANGDYISYSTTTNAGSLGQYIMPCQAFFAYTTGNGSVNFTDGARTHSSPGNFLKSAKTEIPKLFLNVSGDNGGDDIYIHELDADNFGFKFFSMNPKTPQLYVIDEGKSFEHFNIKDFADNTTLQLGFKTTHLGNYTLNATELTINDYDVFLVDNLKETTVKLTNETEYTFNHELDEESNRFELIFSPTNATDVHKNIMSDNVQWCDIINDRNGLSLRITNTNNARVTVYNILGSRVLQKQLQEGMNHLVLNQRGIYIIQVTSEFGTIQEKYVFSK